MFSLTKEAVNSLAQLLKCADCEMANISTDLYGVGSCEHFFCNSCIKKCLSLSKCCVCNKTLTADLEEVPYEELKNIANQVQQLKDVLASCSLNAGTDENSDSGNQLERVGRTKPRQLKTIDKINVAVRSYRDSRKDFFQNKGTTISAKQSAGTTSNMSANKAIETTVEPLTPTKVKKPVVIVVPKNKRKSDRSLNSTNLANEVGIRSDAGTDRPAEQIDHSFDALHEGLEIDNNNSAKKKAMVEADSDTSFSTTPTGNRRRRSRLSFCFGTPREKRNVRGESALQEACIKGNVNYVTELLKSGAAVNVMDNAGWTPLHEACIHGFAPIVTLLLDHGALVDVPARDGNVTPMHDAVSNGHFEVVRALVKRGASLKARNSLGQTPLMLAEACGRMQIADYLREQGRRISDVHPVQPVLVCRESCDYVVAVSRFVTTQNSVNAMYERVVTMGAMRKSDGNEVNRGVTHLIVAPGKKEGNALRTEHVLAALMVGAWIVDTRWLEECCKMGSIVPEEPYEVRTIGTSDHQGVAKKARENFAFLKPGLFNNCSFYFLVGNSTPSDLPDMQLLTKLVKLGDGTVLSREPTNDMKAHGVPYHANPESSDYHRNTFIVYQTGSVEEKDKAHCLEYDKTIKAVSSKWIMECMTSFALLPFE